MHRRLAALVPLLLLTSLPACRSTPEAGPDVTVALVEGEAISLDELDAYVKEELFERETRGRNASRVYQTRVAALDQLLAERALEIMAKRRGLEVDALVAAEAEARGPISDEQIAGFYQAHRKELSDVTLEEITPRIREHLEAERERAAVEALVEEASVEVRLTPPRIEIATEGPSLGPDDAPVTLVEFSDFQCPFCQRAEPVVKEITSRYPTQLRVVYRHLPLDRLHPRARAAAEAAACADEQGRFWSFHDVLFANPHALADEDLKRYAATVGLESAPFEECVASRRHAQRVQADADEARRIGITGTPAWVLNGRVIFGLKTAEELDALIREELEGAG